MKNIIYFLIVLCVVSCSKKKTVLTEMPSDLIESKTTVQKAKIPLITTSKPQGTVDEVYIKETIYFDFDRSEIRAKEVYKLDGIVNAIEDGLTLAIDGHACEIGTDEYNYNLGLQRAKEVERYLSQHVKAEYIVKSYGESKPVSDNKEKNRRVEIYTLK